MEYSTFEHNQHSSCVDQLPLAMAYVPMQSWCHIYELQTGFKKGTIFPELNKPFYGAGGAPCYK